MSGLKAPYEDAVVVVTGASTGLGRAIAIGVARQGARAVIINYASSDAEAQETARQVSEAGAEAILAKGDVGQEADCRRIIAAAEPFGRIDALFNNAGISTVAAYLDLDKLGADDFLSMYRVNVVGPYQMVRAARAMMQVSENAAVVMTSSIAGVTGGGSSIAYAASKAALNAMTKGLARAVAPKIRVNAICPGFIDSPWFDKLEYQGGKDKLKEMIAATTPLKAVSSPEDIADTALFLGSPAARHVTGETLIVDAGLHLGAG
jgi:3-oxoacyl-[acyl-carrier protein] reductase